ncbi:MAG: tol-pal system protein YbgF [Proteobacteria bacterium]|nr:tol-pal system protein YbgF [Pseudomonadota bacterium]
MNACATTNEIADLNANVTALKTEISSLQQANKNLQKKFANLDSRIDDEIKTDLQELRGKLDEKDRALQNRLKETEERIAQLEAKKPIPTPSSPPSDLHSSTPSYSKPSGSLDPEEIYAEAYNLYKEKRFSPARDSLLKFLNQFPDTEYSDNAQFWVAECYYKEGKYEEAILAYEEVVQKYPQGNKLPDALLKQGLCFQAMGDTISFRILLQRVIETYPKSPQAEIARKEIEKT